MSSARSWLGFLLVAAVAVLVIGEAVTMKTVLDLRQQVEHQQGDLRSLSQQGALLDGLGRRVVTLESRVTAAPSATPAPAALVTSVVGADAGCSSASPVRVKWVVAGIQNDFCVPRDSACATQVRIGYALPPACQ